MSMNQSMSFKHHWTFVLIMFYRMKVDLTRYIEQHSFTYDDVFDHDASNEQVHCFGDKHDGGYIYVIY